ncbi:hypothetical protein [Nitrosococcus oceani]|uniref:hypothetical protein n=1 Tax=Nitrosococcus oceani TaxID=1229 RepID=UPI0004E90814|nr:hypothetical protein [Nitrosococcus oceani]KFI23567.1 hypothetical protein HW44_03060 [Nitrosococcus oceani]
MKHTAIALTVMLLSSCASMPQDAFKLTESALQQRQIETRKYDQIQESTLLSACANVLQDMGFQIDEAETELGVIVGSKQRDATNAGQVVASILLAILGARPQAMDKDQTIRVSVVSRPEYNDSSFATSNFLVRATFQRIVRKTNGSMYAETLADEELYQGFFSNLSKSVFIEGQML